MEKRIERLEQKAGELKSKNKALKKRIDKLEKDAVINERLMTEMRGAIDALSKMVERILVSPSFDKPNTIPSIDDIPMNDPDADEIIDELYGDELEDDIDEDDDADIGMNITFTGLPYPPPEAVVKKIKELENVLIESTTGVKVDELDEDIESFVEENEDSILEVKCIPLKGIPEAQEQLIQAAKVLRDIFKPFRTEEIPKERPAVRIYAWAKDDVNKKGKHEKGNIPPYNPTVGDGK